MRVGTRLAGGFLILILIFAGLLTFYSRVVERSVATAVDLASVDSRLLLATASQLELLTRLEDDATKYRITRDSRYFDSYRARRVAFGDTLGMLLDLPVDPGPRDALEAAGTTWGEFEERFVGDRDEAAEARLLLGLSAEAWADFEDKTGTLETQTVSARLSSRGSVESKILTLATEANRARSTGLMTILAAFAIGAVLAFLIVRSIARPLARIERGTAALARGDFSSRVDVPGRSEFADLARRFNHMADRLAELDRAKRDFLARVSHDLKTPLASIRETQRVLLEGAPGDLNPKQRRLTELGLANAERLATMISRILELSRLEAGVEEYDFVPVDLKGVCEATVERFSPHGKPRIAVMAEESNTRVRGDRAALERVLENLLENARVHAGGETIHVKVARVRSARRGPRVLVSVRDEGPGIPEEDRQSIFGSFSHRRDGSIASGHVGLGLAICREIVMAHEGEIWAENAEGGGSMFVFAIPATAEAPRPETGDDAPETAAAAGRRVPQAALSIALAGALLSGCAASAPPPAEPEVVIVPVATTQPPPEAAPERTTPPPVEIFHLRFEEGRWTEALEAFEKDPALQGREEALFRVGLIHALPGRETYDPAAARGYMRRLLALYPESRNAPAAQVVLGLVGQLDQSSEALAVLREQLERLKAVDLKDPPPN